MDFALYGIVWLNYQVGNPQQTAINFGYELNQDDKYPRIYHNFNPERTLVYKLIREILSEKWPSINLLLDN